MYMGTIDNYYVDRKPKNDGLNLLADKVKNDELANSRMKEKYFEQAQGQTGVVSGLVKIFNSFVSEYDSSLRRFTGVIEYTEESYKRNSSEYRNKRVEAQEKFNSEIQALRTKASEQIDNEIQNMRDRIEAVISENLPDGAMEDIQLIKTIAGTMSDDEVKVYLKKYRKCYLVSKVIFNTLSEEQVKRLGVDFMTTDRISELITYVENVSDKFIRNYNGFLSYEVATILTGTKIISLNDAFESFISGYEE